MINDIEIMLFMINNFIMNKIVLYNMMLYRLLFVRCDYYLKMERKVVLIK